MPRVVAVTPGDGRDLAPWIAALSDLPGLVIREPDRPASAVRALAERAIAVGIPAVAVHVKCAGAREIARDLGVGVHRSAHVGPPGGVRWHSASCHGWSAVEDALAQGARFVFLSPIWRPGSKPEDTRRPLGPGVFAGRDGRRVLALGGITVSRAVRARASGAAGVAVCGALFGAPCPEECARTLAGLLAAVGGDEMRSGSRRRLGPASEVS